MLECRDTCTGCNNTTASRAPVSYSKRALPRLATCHTCGTRIYPHCAWLQVTEEQEGAWAADPSAFLEDEDPDAFSLRSACRAMISDLQARWLPCAC